MKKPAFTLFLMSLSLSIASLAISTGPLFADQETLVVTAQVPDSPPDISVVILKFTDGNPDNDPWTNSVQVSSLDFGQLTYLLKDNSNAGSFYSQNGFCVNIYATSFGKPYEIRSTCTGITSGANKLPDGSFGLSPVYSETDKWKTPGSEIDQGAMPSGAQLGTTGPATQNNALVYSSEPAGSARIIQTYFSIPPAAAGGGEPFAGYKPIPLTQPPGSYTGTVLLTLSLK